MEFWHGSGISWTIKCKQSDPHSREITSPTFRHTIFTGRKLFLTPGQQCQSTEGTSISINSNECTQTVCYPIGNTLTLLMRYQESRHVKLLDNHLNTVFFK